VDPINHLVVSCGFDNKIKIYKKNKENYEPIRELYNCLGGKEINFIELSPEHSFIALAGFDSFIYFFDYATLKLLKILKIPLSIFYIKDE